MFWVSGQDLWEDDIELPEAFTGGSERCRLKRGKNEKKKIFG